MIGRRSLLASGLLAGGAALFGAAWLREADRIGTGEVFGTDDAPALNAWLRIDADGGVHVAMPRAEMGQGVTNAIAMIAAEELDADWSRVSVAHPPPHRVYANLVVMATATPFADEDTDLAARLARRAFRATGRSLSLDITGGSTSVRDAWESTRLAAASARAALVAAAAKRWSVAERDCRTEAGAVLGPGGRRAGYGELAAAAAGLSPPPPQPKAPARYRLLGRPLPRADIPAKTDGSARFACDVREPGMLFAALRHGPRFGDRLARYDDSAILERRGVEKVVDLDDAVAVVADNWWRAQQAVQALPAEFKGGDGDLDTAAIEAGLRAALEADDATVYEEEGAVDAMLAGGDLVRAEYRAPVLAHATMEPMSATARVRDGRCDLWVGTQSVVLSRMVAADAAGLDTEQVTVHPLLLGGGFGRRAEADFVREAVRCAAACEPHPVQLQWSREEDVQHDVYRPAAMARFAARLDARGRPAAWLNRIASASVYESAVGRIQPLLAEDMKAKINAEGAMHQPYALGARRIEHVIRNTALPAGFWRSVGHSFNAFFKESFIDELAQAAGADPLQYRLDLLEAAPRHARALAMAGDKAGWTPRPGPGRGMGCALHESFGSICAQVASVSVADGRIAVEHVVCVVDCGTVVNPDTVIAQMESGITFGLSAALYGRITLENGAVQQGNFDDYRICRRAELPAIRTFIIANGEPPGGIGEVGTPPIAPAVANAVFAATGQRLRSLPLALPA